MGRFFFTLTAALAEVERRIIGERTKAAFLSSKRSRHEKTGGDIPFGYDLTPAGLLIKNHTEQKVIRLIRRLHQKGYSLKGICSEFEKEGYKTKRGNYKWHPQTVSGSLHQKSGG